MALRTKDGNEGEAIGKQPPDHQSGERIETAATLRTLRTIARMIWRIRGYGSAMKAYFAVRYFS
jgi:hypothetical protein